jgi:hypothetical protein
MRGIGPVEACEIPWSDDTRSPSPCPSI